MTPLRKRTQDYLTIGGYSSSTKKSYIFHLQQFALYFNCCPSQLGEPQIIEYLRHLAEDKIVSKSTINTAYSALKLLYTHILDQPWNKVHLPRPKREKKLPLVLSKEQVQQIFAVTSNLKHRTILMLTYSAGLRLGEATRVKVKHLTKCRKRIFIQQAKGGKDRYSILSDKMLEQLALYQKHYRPHNWLFCGAQINQPISNRTLQAIYSQAKKRLWWSWAI